MSRPVKTLLEVRDALVEIVVELEGASVPVGKGHLPMPIPTPREKRFSRRLDRLVLDLSRILGVT